MKLGVNVGVGSGFCIEHSGSPVNLVTLYTTTRAERKSPMQCSSNRLLMSPAHSEAKLTNAVSDLCRQADSFMLVIDATAGPSKYCKTAILVGFLK